MNQLDIENQKRVLARTEKELAPLKKQETEAIRLWVLGYKKYLSAVQQLNNRRKKNLTTDVVKGGKINEKVKKLWETLDGWNEKSEELTQRRDAARAAMEAKKQEILAQERELEKILHEYQIQTKETDGMVEKIFMLNEGVVSTLENMDKFLNDEVYPKLHEKATQKGIENSESTKRLVIMTNSINIMDISKVQEAKALIDEFFNRINPSKDVESQDDTIKMLSDLIKELLDVKIKVKAGPNLSKFLALELSEEKFPELRKAQRLLASATNYVRSGKYVRLYERPTKNDSWEPVRQS